MYAKCNQLYKVHILMQAYREGHLNMVICAVEVRMGVCKTLLPDVVAHEVHQKVCELSWPTFDSQI